MMRSAVLYDLNGSGTWRLTRAEATYDVARGRQLGDTIAEWATTDRDGNRFRVVLHEGVTRDGAPIGGVYVIPA